MRHFRKKKQINLRSIWKSVPGVYIYEGLVKDDIFPGSSQGPGWIQYYLHEIIITEWLDSWLAIRFSKERCLERAVSSPPAPSLGSPTGNRSKRSSLPKSWSGWRIRKGQYIIQHICGAFLQCTIIISCFYWLTFIKLVSRKSVNCCCLGDLRSDSLFQFKSLIQPTTPNTLSRGNNHPDHRNTPTTPNTPTTWIQTEGHLIVKLFEQWFKFVNL